MDKEQRSSEMLALIGASVIAGIIAMIGLLIWQRNNDNMSMAETIARKTPSDLPWPADHPVLSGLIVFGIVLLVGRVYLFMRRLENRS